MTRPSRYTVVYYVTIGLNWLMMTVNFVFYLRDRSLSNTIAVILPSTIVFGFEVTHRILKRHEASDAARQALNDKMATGMAENMAQLQRAMSAQLGVSIEIGDDSERKH